MYALSGANEHGHGDETRSRQASSVRAERADRMTELQAARNTTERVAAGHVLGPSDIVGLQRLVGNRAVSAAVSRGQRDAAPAADIDTGTDSASPIRDVIARSGPPLDHTHTRHAAAPATVQRLVVIPARLEEEYMSREAVDRAFHMAVKRKIPTTDPRAKPHALTKKRVLRTETFPYFKRVGLLEDPALLPDDETLVIWAHGSAAGPGHEPTVGGLTAQQLYDRLEHAGWKETHRGRIVFHACMAGMRRAGHPSFIDLFSNIVYSHGRRNPIKGYTGVLFTKRYKGHPSKKTRRTVLKGEEANEAVWIEDRLDEVLRLYRQVKRHYTGSEDVVKAWEAYKSDFNNLAKFYEDEELGVPDVVQEAKRLTSIPGGLDENGKPTIPVTEIREFQARVLLVQKSGRSSTKDLKQLTSYERWEWDRRGQELETFS